MNRSDMHTKDDPVKMTEIVQEKVLGIDEEEEVKGDKSNLAVQSSGNQK